MKQQEDTIKQIQQDIQRAQQSLDIAKFLQKAQDNIESIRLFNIVTNHYIELDFNQTEAIQQHFVDETQGILENI